MNSVENALPQTEKKEKWIEREEKQADRQVQRQKERALGLCYKTLRTYIKRTDL